MKNKSSYAAVLLSILTLVSFAACGGQADSDSRGSVATSPPPATADGTVRYVVDGLVRHEPQRVWAGLPASYQSDVNGVISDFSETLDEEIYDRAFVLLGRLGQILEDKKDLFLASQMVPDAIDRDELAANWDAFVGVIRTISASDIAHVDTLRSLNVERFLATTGADLMANAERLAATAGEDMFEAVRDLEIEVIESGDDRATIRVQGIEHSEVVEMVRLEDRWIPAEMAEEWGEAIAEIRAQIDEISGEQLQAMKPQILGLYGMIEGTLSQLEAAESEAQIDAALQGVVAAVMGMLMGAAMQGMEMN